MDCETVYVQMLSLLFKGCLCGLYHFFCASDTCISPLFKFSSVQDGIFALKKAHMHSTSVQFRMVFMHSKKPICIQVQFKMVFMRSEKPIRAPPCLSFFKRCLWNVPHASLPVYQHYALSRCLRDIFVDCVTVYVQMHFLLLKGAVSGWQQLAVRRHHGTDQAVCGPGRIRSLPEGGGSSDQSRGGGTEGSGRSVDLGRSFEFAQGDQFAKIGQFAQEGWLA